MRILIFGGTGMLGHKLAQALSPAFETIVTSRGDAQSWPRSILVARVVGSIDARDTTLVSRLLDQYRPEAVLNAVGVVKQIVAESDPGEILALNALFPVMLGRLCGARNIRLIHYSTDCVFSGAESGERGPAGYRETDLPDARDLYGMSKLLGESPSIQALVMRTSIIGRELRGRHGLTEWFLSQGSGSVKGFTRALFTGLTTMELAHVTAMVLRDYPDMNGLWHVAAQPIDKCGLLGLIRESYGRRTEIRPHDEFCCDRRLDGSRFTHATGWQPPPWPRMIAVMRNDPLNYEEL